MSRKWTSIIISTLLFGVLFIASFQAVAVTWSVELTRMTAELIFDGNPSIMQAHDGRIWLIWTRAVMGDNTIFCKISSDLGLTWSDPLNLTYIPPMIVTAHDESPSIIQSANGTIWLVYSSTKPPPLPDFDLYVYPKELSITQMSSKKSAIEVWSRLGFNETVTLSTKLISPSGNTTHGINTTFSENPVTPPIGGVAFSEVTVTVNATANPGDYLLVVIGRSENITHSEVISLEVTRPYELVVNSDPIVGVDFTVDGENHTTNWSDLLGEGNHTVVMPSNWTDGLDFYVFDEWEDASTNSTRVVSLTANTTVTAYYVYESAAPAAGSDTAHSSTPLVGAMSSPALTSSSASSESGGYERDYEIYYKVSHDNGASWSDRVQLTNNTDDDLSPSIVQLANGSIMIVHSCEEGSPPDSNNVYYSLTTDWTSWIYGNITTDVGFDRGSCVMQAEDEKIWAAWSSNRTGNPEIFSKTYNGSSWSNATQLTNSTDLDSAPALCQTVDDTLLLFWQASKDKMGSPPADVYYKNSSDNGVTWSNRTQFTTDHYNDLWPTVTQIRDTSVWVAWTSDRADQPDGNWDIWLRKSLAGDVIEDGVVDIYDLTHVAKAYGTAIGDPGYVSTADINKDDRVDIRDLIIVSKNFGAT